MIHIQGDWYIDADQTNYILCRRVEVERKDKDTGAPCKVIEPRDQTFHRTIQQAATAYLRRMQRTAVEISDFELKDAVRALQGLTDDVQMLFKEEVT